MASTTSPERFPLPIMPFKPISNVDSDRKSVNVGGIGLHIDGQSRNRAAKVSGAMASFSLNCPKILLPTGEVSRHAYS